MRVLQIHKTFRATGGADTFFFKTNDLLTAKGHEVAHFSTKHPQNLPSPYSSYFVDGFTEEGVGRLTLAQKTKAFVGGIYSLEAKKKLRQLVEDFRPDIAHAHSFNYQLSPSIFEVFRDAKVPLVVTLHDYHLVCGAGTLFVKGGACERCRGGKHYNLILNSCYWNLPASIMGAASHYVHDMLGSWNIASKFLVPSIFLRDKLIEFHISPDRIIHLPIFIDFPESLPGTVGRGKYVLYFGRLAENKGVKTLVEASNLLRCPLLLIGDGPLSAWVEKGCAASSGRIQRIPFVSSREELRRYIDDAYFCVVPSLWYENQPATVLEAYAAGKAVVGSRMGGIPELIEDGHTGLLCKPGDPADLADKMQFTLDQPDLCKKWGTNGNRKLRDGFSRELHYSSLMKVYSSLVHPGSTDALYPSAGARVQ